MRSALLLATAVVVVASVAFQFDSGGSSGRSGAAAARPASGCPDAREGARWYAGHVRRWRALLGLSELDFPRPRNCREARSAGDYRRHVARRHRRYYERLASTPEVAIRVVFGPYSEQALAVARCESGLSPNAENGQYLGLFQMGSYARSLYGHGPRAPEQARYAYRYFVASGRDWSPWSCKP